MNFRNKLERLSLGKPFQPFLKFVCKAINTRRGWKGLPVTSTLAVTKTVNYGRNKFNDTGHRRDPMEVCSPVPVAIVV